MQSALIADAKPRLEGAPQRNTTTRVCAGHQRFCFLRKLSTEAKAKKAYLQFAFPYVYITKTKTFPNLFPESFRGFNNFFLAGYSQANQTVVRDLRGGYRPLSSCNTFT